MSSLPNQTLNFKDLPVGTEFLHPKTTVTYIKTTSTNHSNARVAGWQAERVRILVHPETIIELTSNIDFFSLNYSAQFAYENTLYIKVARNRARVVNNSDIVKHFEPSDSVSPL